MCVSSARAGRLIAVFHLTLGVTRCGPISSVFVPNFGKEKQCVLVLNFGKEKQRAFVPKFWYRIVVQKSNTSIREVARSLPNFGKEKQCVLYRISAEKSGFCTVF